MKLSHNLIAIISLLQLASCQTPHNHDSVVDAKIASAMAATEKISPANSEFLIQMADARLMDLAAAELAEIKSSKTAIKDYGKKMLLEQDILIEELRSLAQMNGVTLPGEMSAENKASIEELKKLSGKKFDKKFMTLTKNNHELDIQRFRDVKVSETHANDPAIGAYAKNRLPMIEEHLAQVQKLQKKYK